jgi:rhomboid protease GluP
VDPGAQPNPEILRAEENFNPPPPPVRRRRPSWSYAPATYALVAFNCLIFMVMTLRGVSVWGSTADQLMMYWGADNAGSVLVYSQWWRIVTAMFVHVGWIHLLGNMWCLWNLGLLAEPLLGSAGVLAVYILTGAAGNLLSTFVNWLKYSPSPEWAINHSLTAFPAGAGASGAVFGIAGALIILLKSHRLPVPPLELHKLRRSVIYFAAINLVIGFTISLGVVVRHTGVSIDNMAHLGGFMCGLIFAAPLVPRIGASRELFLFRRRAATVMVVGMLVLSSFYLAQLPR